MPPKGRPKGTTKKVMRGRKRLGATSYKATDSYLIQKKDAYKLAKPFGGFNLNDPFPKYLSTKVTYVESLALSTTNLTQNCGTTTYLGLNALYDVYLAAGGHQPYGFDQLCSSTGPYARYKVYGVLIDIIAYDPNPTNTAGTHICLALHDPSGYAAGETISALPVDKISEKMNCWTKYIPTTGKQSVRMTKYFNMNKLFNLTKSQYNNDIGSTTGNYAGNPGSIAALEMGVLDVRASAQYNILVKCKLTFFTQFYDRLQLSSS